LELILELGNLVLLKFVPEMCQDFVKRVEFVCFVGCVESGNQLDFVNVFGKLLIFGGFVEVGVSALEVRCSIL